MISDESSVPEMLRWSFVLIKSDLKWCLHFDRSLFLYWKERSDAKIFSYTSIYLASAKNEGNNKAFLLKYYVHNYVEILRGGKQEVVWISVHYDLRYVQLEFIDDRLPSIHVLGSA